MRGRVCLGHRNNAMQHTTRKVIQMTYANKGLATRAANKQGLAKDSYTVQPTDDGKFVIVMNPLTKAEQHALDVAARKADREAKKAAKVAAKAEALAKRLAEPKVTALPVKPSTVDKPVDVARAYIVAHLDTMTRKEIILHLVNNVGLNRNMVQTRYSWIKAGTDPMFKAQAREEAKIADLEREADEQAALARGEAQAPVTGTVDAEQPTA